MTAEELLKNHIELCDEVYSILIEENRHLRTNQTPTPASILEKKKEILPKLDQSITGIKKLGGILDTHDKKLPPNLKTIAKDAQNKLMKIFYLDRENETLILKSSIPAKPTPLTNRPANKQALDTLRKSLERQDGL